MQPTPRATSLPRLATRQLLGFALAVLVCAAWPATARACDIKPYPDQFVAETMLPPSVPPPPAPVLAGVDVRRSEHAPPGTGDCKDVGFLTLRFARADGTSWPASVGVRLAVVSGTVPQTFTFPSYPLQATEGTLLFGGGDDPSLAFDFTLHATAVSASGAESEPIEVHVSDPGRSSGCAIGGGAGRLGAVTLVFFVLCGLALARVRGRG